MAAGRQRMDEVKPDIMLPFSNDEDSLSCISECLLSSLDFHPAPVSTGNCSGFLCLLLSYYLYVLYIDCMVCMQYMYE